MKDGRAQRKDVKEERKGGCEDMKEGRKKGCMKEGHEDCA